MYGYHGQYLRIDLTTRSWSTVSLSEDQLRQHIGGVGLGTLILLRETYGRHVDSLSPASPVLFVFSPLVGSPLTTSAKLAVLSKSPLTQRINDSLSSSHFAISGKRTGHDAICIVGASDSWASIRITNDQVEFDDASHLLGLSASAASDQLRSQHGNAYRVAAIGHAGENLVKYATISNDGRHAGRGGLGAVMGSKRVKAVMVTGDKLAQYAHPEQLIRYSKELSKQSLGEGTAKYRELGTVSNLVTFNRLGTLPTRNFQQSTFSEALAIAPDNLSTERARSSCAACTIGCEHFFKSQSKSVRLEYENLYALGPMCGISDPETVLAASSFCDEVGIDTISAGATIAFAMECAEKGLLDEPWLRFGSNEALLRALKMIAERVDVGELLADGSRLAAEQIGHGSAAFAPHAKGLELPGYDPRALQTMALGFAVGTRGADHNRSGAYQVDFSPETDRFAPDESAIQRAIEIENEAAIMDSLILCKFLRGIFEDKFAAMADMLHLITGWDISREELIETAGSIIDQKKRFNVHQGWTHEEDTLPDRFFDLAIPEGPSQNAVLTRERLRHQIQHYYHLRGWDENGRPATHTFS